MASGLFTGAWRVEILALLATLAAGFGIGLVLSSFLLGFLAVLVAAVLVFLVFSLLSRSDPHGSSKPPEHRLQNEPEHPRVHS